MVDEFLLKASTMPELAPVANYLYDMAKPLNENDKDHLYSLVVKHNRQT
jgi:hypothetical protein